MKKYIASTVLAVALIGIGAAPALAGHAHKSYGVSQGKMSGYGSGMPHYGKHHGMGHRNGYRGKHYGGAHQRPHPHAWSKGHAHRYGYKKPMGCHHHRYPMGHSGKAAYDRPTGQPASQPGYAPQPAGPAPTDNPAVAKASLGTIVDTAVAADDFATLVSAVKAADLATTLSGEGPFTVFAPTDEAFSKLPEGTVPGLLSNTDALTKVLTYHVVAGRLDAADLVEQGEFETLNGATVTLEQIKVAKADVEASNGVIHIVDEVLLPPGS